MGEARESGGSDIAGAALSRGRGIEHNAAMRQADHPAPPPKRTGGPVARPAARWRRWRRGVVLLVVLAAALLAANAYRRATDPDRLAAAVAKLFADLPDAEVRTGRVTFSLWSGLTVEQLDVSLSSDAALARAAAGAEAIPILSVSQARVACRWLPLLAGRFAPARITLDQVMLTVARGPDGLSNIGLAGAESDADVDDISDYPDLRLTRGQLRLVALVGGRLVERERWAIDVRGARDPSGAADTYVFDVRRDPPTRPGRPLIALRLRPADESLAASIDWLPLETVRFLIGAGGGDDRGLTALIERLDLRGEAMVSDLRLRGEQPAGYTLRVRNLRAALPVEVADDPPTADGPDAPPAERFLQLSEASGALTFTGDALQANLDGRLNGGPLQFHLTGIPPAGTAAADLDPTDWSTWDLALTLNAGPLDLPTFDTAPAFVTSPRLSHAMRSFFRDYRARGPVTISVSAARPGAAAGAEPAAWQMEGELEAHGLTAEYFRFPLPVEDVRGGFRLVDGGFELQSLTARHGSGIIRGSGRVHSTRSFTGFELQFRGTNIPLDHALYEALPREYRALWDETRPIGLADVDVTLTRPSGSRATGALPTDTVVTARLLTGSARLDQGRVQETDGLIDIRDGVLTVRRLRGTLGDALVEVSGWAQSGDGPEHWWFEAGDVPVSQTTSAAAVGLTPPRGVAGGVASGLAPLAFAGTADVWGQIAQHDAQRARELTVHIKDGQLGSFDPAHAWGDARGWLAVSEDAQTLHAFTADTDFGTLSVTGRLEEGEAGLEPRWLDIAAETRAIERLLRQVVPPERWSLLDGLGLSGAGRVTAAVRTEAGEPPRAELDVVAAQMRPRAAPLELRNVRAVVELGGQG
jgi:hypothetical protein